jgi:serine phosphatase RsbU (regulator of sigma subunit)
MDLKLRLAHKLQFRMLPRDTPPESPLRIAAVLESYCHLSGDLFGWESFPDGRFLLWIVDLSGHGVRSGLASAVLKVILDHAPGRSRVGDLVGRLNAALAECVREPFHNLYATGVFLMLGRDGSAEFVSAGHPPVLVRSRDKELRELRSNTLPIGMFPGHDYAVETTRLDRGDTLLLFTDGVLEAANAQGETFGLDRLRRSLLPDFDAPEIASHRLYRQLSRHQDMDRLHDDVSLVVATWDGEAYAGRRALDPGP